MEEPRDCSALAIFGDFRQDFRDGAIKMQPEWTRARGQLLICSRIFFVALTTGRGNDNERVN